MNNIYETIYDAELKAVISIWKGYATSGQFRDGTEELLRIMVEKEASRVLVDLKEMILIGKEDQDWMDRSYVPLAVSQGMRTVACVQPTYYFNKVAVQNITYSFNEQKVEVHFFEEFEQARNFLLAK